MINTILGKIAGVFEKDFLFASFLPAIILCAWALAALVVVFGVDHVSAAYDELSGTQKAGLATLGTLVLVVTAYLLSSLRGLFIRIWSGESAVFNLIFHAPLKLLSRRQTKYFLALRRSSKREIDWAELAETFRNDVSASWRADRATPGRFRKLWMEYRAHSLSRDMSEEALQRRLNEIAGCFKKFSGDELRPVYARVKRSLTDWAEEDRFALQRDAVLLDRRFGPYATIKPYALGNIIEAYNHYAYSRYRMETELFWPRLLKVVPADFLERVNEPKILLDFAVTMTTVNVFVVLSTALFGPWMWANFSVLFGLIAFQLIAAAFFYALSVFAASQYGDMVRACFDLFRLDLLKELSFERPSTLTDERAVWERISQLMVYGQEVALDIAPEPQEEKP